MTTEQHPDLRTTLRRVADATEPMPVADDLWQRGQRARRRAQVLAVAAVVAVLASLGGMVTLVQTDREVRTASTDVVEGGAIPSRIEDPEGLTATDDLAVGRASVAFVSSSADVVVVTAQDGRYHALDLPEAPLLGPVRLSPDGRHLAYAYRSPFDEERAVEAGTVLVDLTSGEVRRVPAVSGSGLPVAVSSIGWSADSAYVAWSGLGMRVWTDTEIRSEVRGGMVGVIAVAGGSQSTIAAAEGMAAVDADAIATLVTADSVWTFASQSSGAKEVPIVGGLPSTDIGDTATTSPTGELTALTLRADTGAALLVTEEGDVLRRPLDGELYPHGAQVTPLGWATDSLLLARVDGPSGSYVEGGHLALLTTPDRPRSQWTYRIVMRDVPDVADLSIAVDLVPDLDGTSSQQLTHDFGDTLAGQERDVSWLIGLGVAAAIAVLMGLRWLWRRFLG
jgi:hypothetical protein